MLPSLGQLGAQFKVVQTDYGLLNGSITQVAKQDGTRWAIIFSNNSSTAAIVQFGFGDTTKSGLRINNTTTGTSLHFNDHGGLVQLAMFATCDVPSTLLNVIEVFYIPSGDITAEV